MKKTRQNKKRQNIVQNIVKVLQYSVYFSFALWFTYQILIKL